ncbi:MAG: penicillin-binding protein 2 [Candidatus Daviesbacteria bacterium]|nr:penicillin-binding protein 2 [Candidatus Daviesbacteria bacterium]
MRIKQKKLGYAFKDEVFKVTHPFGHFKRHKINNDDEWADTFIPNYNLEDDDVRTHSPWRLAILASIMMIIFAGIFFRLFHLQVVMGAENKQRADSNRIQLKVIHAHRGVIYDRNNKVLAENTPGFRIGKNIITRDESLMFEAKQDPSLNKLEIDSIRRYPQGEAISHVLGYVGQISEDELKDTQNKNYKLGDRIGRSGVEQVYESVLKGIDGAEIIEIDASGNKLRTLGRVEPIPGQNVHLSIDLDLQKATYQYLSTAINKEKICCGAAIVQNPNNGQILAMVSIPSYDNNAFTDPGKNNLISNYFNDPNSPLLNRAISGTYAPGSTFKIASALAGLSSGKITGSTQIEDTGVMKIDTWSFANWYFISSGKTDGMVDVVKALERSNDIFFYQLGALVGEKTLGDTAKKLGMGKKLGIDLPGEADGLIPDGAWKQKNIGDVWYPGDSLHMAIGQGFVLVTPLQILSETSFIANSGTLLRPSVVDFISKADNQIIKQFKYDPLVNNIFKKADIDLVKSGLSRVPQSQGTAWPFFGFTIPTAGKTGTAETGEVGKTQAWYTSYAPIDNPQLTATVLLEKGGEGSNVSAPVVKDIFTWYFSPDKNHLSDFGGVHFASASAKILGE